jgi:ATP-dependent Zn protease
MNMMQTAHEDVITLLTDNRPTLEILAQELLDRETLGEEDIAKIMAARNSGAGGETDNQANTDNTDNTENAIS